MVSRYLHSETVSSYWVDTVRFKVAMFCKTVTELRYAGPSTVYCSRAPVIFRFGPGNIETVKQLNGVTCVRVTHGIFKGISYPGYANIILQIYA